ncbi:hypothetical protein [Mesorhizobium sp. L-2-11]|uniref:hypothetical protein n=1 Tax=Mesorhizobium sp. L-2-11 TaxID=2744521 RepID=UPI001925BD91|nr:hypothetical protein [Mesorhizobium sp. L-2-11]BCH16336.1 hypothetical protein MesoLjLa_31870 [Mesorhizobium sp. L-2-11]
MHGSYWRGEQALIQQAKAWTVLRMNYYAESFAMEVAAPQTNQIFGLAENKVAFISRNDIAAAAAGMLASDGVSGQPITSGLKFQGMSISISDAGQP